MSENNSAEVIAPGGGEVHSIRGMTIQVKTSGLQSNGAFAVLEVVEPAGSDSPTEWHKRTTVLIYVLEGTLTLTVGGETNRVGPGGYAYVPPGTVYNYANMSEAPVRYLMVQSPAGVEKYIAEGIALFNSIPVWPPEDMSQFLALRANYDVFDPPVA